MRFIAAIASMAIAMESCRGFAPSAARAGRRTSLRMADDGAEEGPIMNRYSR